MGHRTHPLPVLVVLAAPERRLVPLGEAGVQFQFNATKVNQLLMAGMHPLESPTLDQMARRLTLTRLRPTKLMTGHCLPALQPP